MWSMQILRYISIFVNQGQIKNTLVSTFNQKLNKRKENFNRKTRYHGRYRINMTDELDLCDDENILSNKDKLLTTGKLLGVEAITCNEIPNKGLNMTDREM